MLPAAWRPRRPPLRVAFVLSARTTFVMDALGSIAYLAAHHFPHVPFDPLSCRSTRQDDTPTSLPRPAFLCLCLESGFRHPRATHHLFEAIGAEGPDTCAYRASLRRRHFPTIVRRYSIELRRIFSWKLQACSMQPKVNFLPNNACVTRRCRRSSCTSHGPYVHTLDPSVCHQPRSSMLVACTRLTLVNRKNVPTQGTHT
jgi:hypothetical protein